jgi:hypothetical protein
MNMIQIFSWSNESNCSQLRTPDKQYGTCDKIFAITYIKVLIDYVNGFRSVVVVTWSIDGAPKQEIGENEVIVGLVQSVVPIL